ncbi:hypothetical protein KY289_017238 [Solanum tuberosum]|nr:hypothetical protein KY289_017238 [Solanum tuberosum]
MKSVVLLISLLVAFSSSCTATTTPNQVLKVVRDTDGNILRSDNRYFVVSSQGWRSIPRLDRRRVVQGVLELPFNILRSDSRFVKLYA